MPANRYGPLADKDETYKFCLILPLSDHKLNLNIEL